MILSELIDVIDSRGRTLTPCRRKVAEREVRLERAKWVGPRKIRLRFDPFAYRYIRLKVLERDNHTCYWCGGPGDTMDHVIPWSKGGRTTMSNCICACQECNGRRGDTAPEVFAGLCGVPLPQPGGGARPLVVVPPQTEATARPLPLPRLVIQPAARPQVEVRAEVEAVAAPEPSPAARRALSALLDPLGHPAGLRGW